MVLKKLPDHFKDKRAYGNGIGSSTRTQQPIWENNDNKGENEDKLKNRNQTKNLSIMREQ